MDIYVLFIQRKESYAGQYGIEALEVMDEYSYSDNPEYLDKELTKQRLKSDIAKAEIVKISVDEYAVTKILYPDNNVKGNVGV